MVDGRAPLQGCGRREPGPPAGGALMRRHPSLGAAGQSATAIVAVAARRSGVEVEREPEGGKEAFGVQEGEEERHLDDLASADLEDL